VERASDSGRNWIVVRKENDIRRSVGVGRKDLGERDGRGDWVAAMKLGVRGM
jgi:hypothetical protein